MLSIKLENWRIKKGQVLPAPLADNTRPVVGVDVVKKRASEILSVPKNETPHYIAIFESP